MKNNKLFVIVLALCIAGIMAGCSKEDAKSEEEIIAETQAMIEANAEEWAEEDAANVAAEAAAETEEKEPEKVIEPDIQAEYPIYEILSDFSGKRAWVKYTKDNNIHYGLIDTNGFLIYSLDSSDLRDWNWNEAGAITTPEGTCCIYSGPFLGSLKYPGMIIVDSAGNVIFDGNNQGEDTEFYYLGYGDGSYLVLKHIANFSQNGYYFCEMSVSGDIVKEIECNIETDRDSPPLDQNFSYCGCDLFFGTDRNSYIWFYDRANGNFYSSESKFSDQLYPIGIYQEKYIVFQDARVYADFLNIQEGYYYVHSIDTMYNPAEQITVTDAFIRIAKSTYGEGLFNSPDGIYDLSGNLIHTYPEEWEIDYAGPFENGFAILQVIGADGKDYVTAVNAEGTVQYEPILCTFSSWSDVRGFIVVHEDENGSQFIINPEGEKEEYNLSQFGDSCGSWHNGFMRTNHVDSGYTAFSDFYGNLIENVIVVTNYDEVKDTNWLTGEKFTEDVTEEKKEKDYSFISNYIIDGKWINIGADTFGQAQEGAVIVFDGNNCNFFSPNDTYAFYESGDWYQLDCTSPLADTVSFTVKTIDDNHIDIFYGNTIVELERVD